MDSKLSTTVGKHRPLWLWVYTLIGVVVGTGAIFLSFTFDTSPADVLFFGSEVEFWPIASPFLLAIPISVASLRWRWQASRCSFLGCFSWMALLRNGF